MLKTNKDVLMIRGYDDEAEAFYMSDGSYFDILHISTSDRDNLQEDEISYEIMKLEKMELLYTKDYKDIGLNFPLDAEPQKDYLKRTIEKTIDPVRKKWLLRELAEIEALEKETLRREFYRMIFGKNKDEIIKNRENMMQVLKGRLFALNQQKKELIVKKLCNMNTPVWIFEDYDEGEL